MVTAKRSNHKQAQITHAKRRTFYQLVLCDYEYWRYSIPKNKSKSSNPYFKAYEQKRYSVS